METWKIKSHLTNPKWQSHHLYHKDYNDSAKDTWPGNTMLIQIDPSVVKNFLRLKKRRLLGNESKDDLTPRRYKGRRFSGLIVNDNAIQAGRPMEQCPHYRGTLQQFQDGLSWDQTEYVNLYDSWY